MISSAIRQLCLLSLVCGAALTLAPEGTVKRILGIACSAALLLAAVEPLAGLDLSAYALELAKNSERRAEFLDGSADLNQRLNRLVIEEECEAYILDKAEEMGLDLEQAEVLAQWNSEGLWVPASVKLTGQAEQRERRRLGGLIEAELGIPEERQQWTN